VGGLGGDQIIKLSLDALHERGQLLASGRRRAKVQREHRRRAPQRRLVNPTVLLRKFGGSEGGADVPVEGRAGGGGGGGIQDEAGVDGACGRRSTCEHIEYIVYIYCKHA